MKWRMTSSSETSGKPSTSARAKSAPSTSAGEMAGIPQDHPLGDEAEVDFGTVSVYLAGALTEVQLFIMRLSASGRAYPRAYLNEAQEVFLDGHVRAFAHFDGVPRRVRYDNLKSAVEKVLKGRGRVESDRFIALRSHYGFDSFFCLPGIRGAHEKALVSHCTSWVVSSTNMV